jgi:hypothetical protein
MKAVVLVATAFVVTVNVAVVALAATLTLAGTVAAAVLLLLSFTTTPPVGAAPLSVTVPVDEVPPVTPVGLKLTELSAGAPDEVTRGVSLIVSRAVFDNTTLALA